MLGEIRNVRDFANFRGSRVPDRFQRLPYSPVDFYTARGDLRPRAFLSLRCGQTFARPSRTRQRTSAQTPCTSSRRWRDGWNSQPSELCKGLRDVAGTPRVAANSEKRSAVAHRRSSKDPFLKACIKRILKQTTTKSTANDC